MPAKKNAKTKTATEAKVKGTPGRKPAPIVWPRGAFTIKDLFEKNSLANGGSIKVEVTARNAVKRKLISKEVLEVEKVKTGGVGAPATKYILASVKAANEKRKAKKASKPKAPKAPKAKKAVTPVVEVTTPEPEAAPVETPEVAEPVAA